RAHSLPLFPLDVWRFLIAATALGFLVLTRRLSCRDIGLTLGSWRTTLRWVVGPAAVVALVWLAVGIVAILFTRTGIVPPQPIGPNMISDVDQVGGALWRGCLMAPLTEELLYRGVLTSAVERLGGMLAAVLASGFVFVLLHLVYGQPAFAMPEYFLAGAVMAWAFLRSRSLLAPILLHALGNLFVIANDVLLLEQPDLIRAVLWGRG